MDIKSTFPLICLFFFICSCSKERPDYEADAIKLLRNGLTLERDTLDKNTFDHLAILKADLHIHTYYSDGFVSPQQRIDEALKYNFDVIAITDHIEYRPFLKYHPGDHNKSYDEAIGYGNPNIVLIKGTEITRDMPPGHFGFLFINDANKLDLFNLSEVFAEAQRQEAIIIWNHPSWRQQATKGAVWYNFHTQILNKNLLHGIEIHDEILQQDQKAIKWGIEKKLILFSNSDSHQTLANEYENNNKIRYNLIFSQSRDLGDIKKAMLLNRIIAVCYQSFYTSHPTLMDYFIRSILKIKKLDQNLYLCHNLSDHLIEISPSFKPTEIITLHKDGSFIMNLSKGNYLINNFYVNGDKAFEISKSNIASF